MNADKRLPVVTLLLVAANIAAAFLLFWQPDLLDAYGFYAGRPSAVSAITSLFLHANLVHLLGNMVFLAAAGPAAEAAAGSLRFFGVYLASGLAGVAAFWLLGHSADVPMIGASGAVSGCVALASIRFYAVRVPLAPGLSVPIVGVVATWLVLQVVGSFVKLGDAGGGVSYWAHLGGAAAGLLLALAFRTEKEAHRAESAKHLDRLAERGPAAALAAAEEHLKNHPKDIRALVEKGAALAVLGEKRKAADAFLAALDLDSGGQAEILERAAAGGCIGEFSSTKRAAFAAKFRTEREELAAVLLESVVSGPENDAQRPDAMLALADLRRESNPNEARRLAQELFQTYPLHPAAELARAKGWKP